MAILGLLPKSAKVTGSVKLRGEETPRSGRSRHAPGARRAHRHGVPGCAHRAEPGLQGGRPDQRSDPGAPRDWTRQAVRERAIDLLETVGIPNPERRIDQYPHEFSGGMRQRAMIAMSIANEPEVLIADEPTTALDVTIQAQVLEVFERIQERTKSSRHPDHARPRRRRRHGRSGARDVRRARGRAGRRRRALLQPAPSLHAWAAGVVAPRRRAAPRPAQPHQGPAAVADRGAVGLRVPPALRRRRCARAVRDRVARNCAASSPRHRSACHFAEDLPPLEHRPTSAPTSAADERALKEL